MVKLAIECGPIGRVGSLSPGLDEQALLVAEIPEALVVVHLLLLEILELLVRPLLLLVSGEHSQLARVLGQVAHRRRALLADHLAALVDVGGVAAREHRGPGELRLRDLVVEQHAVVRDLVARQDARAEEPPLVAAEDHVLAGDVALDRGAGAVAGVGADRKRLWRHDPAERALGGAALVVVERVRVLHALRPAADVVDVDGLLRAARRRAACRSSDRRRWCRARSGHRGGSWACSWISSLVPRKLRCQTSRRERHCGSTTPSAISSKSTRSFWPMRRRSGGRAQHAADHAQLRVLGELDQRHRVGYAAPGTPGAPAGGRSRS